MFAPLAGASANTASIEDTLTPGLPGPANLRGSAPVATSWQASAQDPAAGSSWPSFESAHRRLSACLQIPDFRSYSTLAPWAFGYLALYNHQKFLGNAYSNSILGIHLTNALMPRSWSIPEYVMNVVLPPAFGYFVGRHYNFVTAAAVTLVHAYGAAYLKR